MADIDDNPFDTSNESDNSEGFFKKKNLSEPQIEEAPFNDATDSNGNESSNSIALKEDSSSNGGNSNGENINKNSESVKDQLKDIFNKNAISNRDRSEENNVESRDTTLRRQWFISAEPEPVKEEVREETQAAEEVKENSNVSLPGANIPLPERKFNWEGHKIPIFIGFTVIVMAGFFIFAKTSDSKSQVVKNQDQDVIKASKFNSKKDKLIFTGPTGGTATIPNQSTPTENNPDLTKPNDVKPDKKDEVSKEINKPKAKEITPPVVVPKPSEIKVPNRYIPAGEGAVFRAGARKERLYEAQAQRELEQLNNSNKALQTKSNSNNTVANNYRGLRIPLVLVEPFRSGMESTVGAEVSGDVLDEQGNVLIPAGTRVLVPFSASEINGRVYNDRNKAITINLEDGNTANFRGIIKSYRDGLPGVTGRTKKIGSRSALSKIGRGVGVIGGGILGIPVGTRIGQGVGQTGQIVGAENVVDLDIGTKFNFIVD